MQRRDFLKIASSIPMLQHACLSRADSGALEPYDGRFLVQLHVRGGWDTASFCDPKINLAGERPIANWSDNAELQQAGNIAYADFAKNRQFFENHFNKMLVINGIDVETSSHEIGEQFSLGGSKRIPYPGLPALFAATKAPNLPLSYLNFSDYQETGGLIVKSRLSQLDSALKILSPNQSQNSPLHNSDALATLLARQALAMEQRLPNAEVNSQQDLAFLRYLQSTKSAPLLTGFADLIKVEMQAGRIPAAKAKDISLDLRSQIPVALIALASGMSSSADLMKPNFDTHANHDPRHYDRLSELAEDIDYFWQYAETLGISERITLVIHSEISRTPWYNDEQGKDHWPINSTIVMEPKAPWANRVIGATDEGLNALKVSASSLHEEDSPEAIKIHPRHIHKSLRRYLGIEQSAGAQSFDFEDVETLNFFG